MTWQIRQYPSGACVAITANQNTRIYNSLPSLLWILRSFDNPRLYNGNIKDMRATPILTITQAQLESMPPLEADFLAHIYATYPELFI